MKTVVLVLLDVHPQEAEGCDPLHAATADEQGLDHSLLPPEDDDLPGFELVQHQVISLALLAHLLHLVPVCGLVSPPPKMRPATVVSSAHFVMSFLGWTGMKSRV